MKSNREQRHASIIFDHGNPIGMGYNDGNNHAEDNAIFDLNINGENKRNKIMVSIRLTRAGRIGLAKPCPACLDLLKEKKFRKVIYSTNEGTFKEIYL